MREENQRIRDEDNGEFPATDAEIPSPRIPPDPEPSKRVLSERCLGLHSPRQARRSGRRPHPIRRAQCLTAPRRPERDQITARPAKAHTVRRPACLVWRLARVVAGATAMGAGLALIIRARLGAQPWDVLHLALAHLLGVTPGTVIIGMSLLVLLLWLPLHQRPGLGTVATTVLPGAACDRVLAALPVPAELLTRSSLLVAGIGVFAAGTALVIRAGLGPGARDGLMTGACARWGWSVRTVRTALELGVLLLGLLLADPLEAVRTGMAGPGTLAVAVTLGPLLGWLLGHRVRRD